MHEKLESILNNPLTIPVAIGVVSFGSGLGLGFLFGKKKYEMAEVIDLFPDETFEVPEVDLIPEQEEPEIVKPPRVVIGPEVAVEKGILKVNDLAALRPDMVGGDSDDLEFEVIEEEVVEEEVVEVEVTDSEWDWDVEVAKRTETAPYTITREEFYADEKGYSQISLRYFARDETLADDDNRPIYDVSRIVGELQFGHGSGGDKDLVFVRNDKLNAEYEIIREDAHYTIEVLGYEEEQKAEATDLRHSKSMRFRME